jgi:hypothetical protein
MLGELLQHVKKYAAYPGRVFLNTPQLLCNTYTSNSGQKKITGGKIKIVNAVDFVKI